MVVLGMQRTVLLLREPEIRRLLDPASCLKAVEDAFTAYATGGASLPAGINLHAEGSRGGIPIKARPLRGPPRYAGKIASRFYDNTPPGPPPHDGTVPGFDARNGALAALR